MSALAVINSVIGCDCCAPHPDCEVCDADDFWDRGYEEHDCPRDSSIAERVVAALTAAGFMEKS